MLKTKLKSPQPLNILVRKRLATLFKDISRQKLIVLNAGAGYGKTTLAAHAFQNTGFRTIWYSLDTFDRDFMVFMTYLIQGFENQYDELDNTMKGLLPDTASPDKKEKFLLRFISNIENKLQTETIVVLDDYHLLGKRNDINHAVEFILDRMPPLLHIVIISRLKIPIRVSKLRVRQQILEITEKDLAFTLHEIKTLCSDIHNIPVATGNINSIHEKTGGWAASLILFIYALKDKKGREIDKTLMQLKGSQKDIFEYLEENIFDALQPEERDFMLKTALFSTIDPEISDTALGIDNSEKLLLRFFEAHLLIFPCDEERRAFYYHHLLRDFLKAKLRKIYTGNEIREIHLAISSAFEKKDIFKALYHAIEGNGFERAASLVEKYEVNYMLEGKIHFVRQYLDKIPVAYMESNPQLLFMAAKLTSFYGNPQEAIVGLKAAHRLFTAENAEKNAVKCLVHLGAQYYLTGHVREARSLMEQVVDELDESSPAFIMTMTYLIFLSAVLGEIEKSDEYAEKSKQIIATYPEYERGVSRSLVDISCTYRYYITGDFEESLHLNRQLLERVLGLNITSCLPLTFFQLALTSFFLGQYERGYDYAKRGIRASEKIDLNDSQKAWIYIAWAQNASGLGNDNEAIDFIRKSLDIFEKPFNRWGIANAHDCLAHICLKKGNPGRARTHLKKAFDIIEGYHLTLTRGILEITLARALMQEREYEHAAGVLRQARSKVDIAKYYLFECHLLESGCLLENGNTPKACISLEKSLDIAREKNFDRFIIKERTWITPLLEQCYSQTPENRYVGTLLKEIKKASTQTLSSRQSPITEGTLSGGRGLSDSPPDMAPPVLQLTLLGKFQVWKGGEKIPQSAWKSSKALMILKYLAAHRKNGFVKREVLIELLWPDQNIKKTGKRFNVAMSALRKTLEPDIAPKAPSSYILRKKDSYSLSPGSHGTIDVETFTSLLNHGAAFYRENPEKSLRCHLNAHALYQGPFLEEDPYEEWCVREREWLNAKFLAVMKKIISCYEIKNDTENCIKYAEIFLQTEKYDEEIYRQLMRFYAENDNNANVIKIFNTCRRNMAMIDCPLSNETVTLFKKLIS